jgi:hypothetical protein
MPRRPESDRRGFPERSCGAGFAQPVWVGAVSSPSLQGPGWIEPSRVSGAEPAAQESLAVLADATPIVSATAAAALLRQSGRGL